MGASDKEVDRQVMEAVFDCHRARDEVTSEHRVYGREVIGVVQEVRRVTGRTSHDTVFTQTDAENPFIGE